MSDFNLDLGDGNDPGIGSDGSDLAPENQDSLANPFLSKIPDADRNVVAKYIKDWDAGVTRRFQQIHQQYAPYKDLGDIESIQGAMALQQMINEDPARVYELLGNFVNQGQEDQQQQQQQVQQYTDEFGEQLPQAFVEKFTRMEGILESLAERFMQTEQQQQADLEDRELDDYLGQLKERYGDFDEDWVLSKMMKGMDGEQAVQQYGKFVQDTINSRMSGKRPVPVLGGGGSVPTNGVDPTKLTRQQTQDLVAQMLADAAAQGQ